MELPPVAEAELPSAAVSSGVIDAGAAVFAEVERGMAGMIEQHTAWLELSAAGHRGEEYDWRTAELLSCLRSIEWDLQDLEDHVSIVEGNRAKFSDLEDSVIEARKTLLDNVRMKIDAVRTNVQEAASSEGGHAATRAKASSALDALAKMRGKGFVKLAEDKHQGVGTFSPAHANQPPSPRCANGGGSTLAGGAGASASGDLGSTEADGKDKPWWLCCC